MAVVMELPRDTSRSQAQLHKLNNLMAKPTTNEQRQTDRQTEREYELKSQSAARVMPIGSCRHHVKQPGASIQVYNLSNGPFRSIWLCFCSRLGFGLDRHTPFYGFKQFCNVS